MQPSSLIFVAIVAIWAAFLVQHWVRRREALATARSVDRFSAAIRLLERTPVHPAAEPRPPLGVRSGAAVSPSPLVARSSTAAAPSTAGALSAAGAASAAGAVPVAGAPVAGAGFRPRPAGPRSAPRHRSMGSRPARWGRRIRGIAFLTLVALVPVTMVLSALSVLKWTSVPVALVALVGGLVMLRYAAVHERTLRRVERSLAASARSMPAPREVASSVAARRAGDRPVPARAVVPAAISGTAEASATTEAATAAKPTAAKPTAAKPSAPEPTSVAEPAGSGPEPRTAEQPVAQGDEPAGERGSRRAAYAAYGGNGTWRPVAVPQPTYTLKARAEHPQPEPAEVTPVPEPAQPAVAAAEPALRAVGD